MTKSKKIISILLAAIIAVSIVVIPVSVSAKSNSKLSVHVSTTYDVDNKMYDLANVSWNKIKNAKTYSLTVLASNFKPNTEKNIKQRSREGLIICSEYGSIIVTAYNKNNKKLCSKKIVLPKSPSKGVTGLKATKVTKNSISLKWNKYKNKVGKYTVRAIEASKTGFGVGFGIGVKPIKNYTSKTKFTIKKGLKKNTKYFVGVDVNIKYNNYVKIHVCSKTIAVKTKKK